ncbi:MAG TPA: hypothetical protein PKE06_06175 [Flavilitoribacter sp.]|nr:hypothetical protein [Flavilitoribacter sp.]HMQ87989.1 hypothetical protein [Flavilitoribacter sp.]
MAKKTITLDMLKSSLEKKKPDIAGMPFYQVAALLYQFDRAELEDLLQKHFKEELSDADFEALVQNCSAGDEPGRHILEDFERNRIIRRLDSDHALTGLVRKLRFSTDDDPFQRLLFDYLGGTAPPLSELKVDEMAIARKIVTWLKGTSLKVPDEKEIHACIKREELLEPFLLITKNFQGRETELDFIRNYVNKKPDAAKGRKDPLLISGIGGIGKSTVIAKFILDHHAGKQKGAIPFIYLDFDRPGYSISEPLELGAEGLRQLSVQFPDPEISLLMDDIRKDIQIYLQNDKAGKGAAQSGTTVATRGIFYGSASRYLIQYQGALNKFREPILVVLDSFEEAQFRASPSDLTKLFDFFKEISYFIPTMNLIIVGRDDLIETDVEFTRYKIGEFDRKAADGFLLSRGVQDAYIREQLVRQLGGNPLSLKLGASHVLKLMAENPGAKLEHLDALFDGIDKERIQEQLVRRNLVHVKGELARKVAFPGLLVRKISPEILQKVLAEPCGLGDIDDNQAQSIFNSLAEQDFLVTREKGSLVFRKDLRVALYDLILKEYGERANRIHDLAVAFYAGRPEPDNRAEYLYHRLKRGDDPEICTQLYSQDMRPYIENALTELPLNAYIRLAALMGLTVGEEAAASASLPEWEDYMIAQIKDILEDGDESGLHRKKKMLMARSERTYSTQLYYYEALMHLRLAEFDAAREILEKARVKNRHHPSWLMLMAQLEEYRRDFDQAFRLLSGFELFPKRNDPVREAVEWGAALARNAARLGIPFEKIADRFSPVHFFFLPGGKLESRQVSDALPPAYRIQSSDLLPSDRPVDARDLIAAFETIWSRSLNSQDFAILYQAVEALRNEKISLEQKLFNKYKVAIHDISLPGTFSINAADALHYLEQRYQGDRDRIAAEFLDLDWVVNKESEQVKGQPMETDLDSLKKEAMNLVSQNEIRKAIELLRANLKDDEKQNDIILIASRYNRLEQDNNRGIISDSDFRTQHSRIANNLLYFLKDLQ